ncbi:hypothetical protein [Nocardiopsis dassonvillei]|nr:hypothetical protein [Nocardiopsis dassonvillei]VEI91155.1 Uncharacterised protein [Nocardiopsis dassonvillei]
MRTEDIRELLDTRRREVGGELAALEAIAVPAEAAGLGQALRLATLSYGITLARAELDWLDATERLLEEDTP